MGVAVDVATGEPINKALLEAGAGVVGGAAGTAAGGAFAVGAFGVLGLTPMGWVVVAGGVIGAIGLSIGASGAAGRLYEDVVQKPILIDDRWSLVEAGT